MTIIVDYDVWPRLKPEIEAERQRTLDALLHISPEKLAMLQGYVKALDWVLDEARPKPPPREDTEEDDD